MTIHSVCVAGDYRSEAVRALSCRREKQACFYPHTSLQNMCQMWAEPFQVTRAVRHPGGYSIPAGKSHIKSP